MNKQLNKAFDEWWCEKKDHYIHEGWCYFESGLNDPSIFSDLPKSMQWGVFQDFYDSQGIRIEISSYNFDKFSYYINQLFEGGHNTRPEARQAALDKAEEVWVKNKL